MEVQTDKFRGRTLPDSVAAKLDNLCALGQLDLQELDERAFDALKELNEDGALGVLDQFANSDLSHVQNKSAFLCGIMKTHREKKRQELNQDVVQQMPNTNAESQVEPAAGPNEEKIRELLDRTGYSLDITMGQRKYGGPPPGWQGSPPPTGPSGCCQVFVGKIPRDMYEDELVPPFEKYGQIYDFRLMMDPHTGQNKGYGFCTFADRESAQSACKGLDNTEIRRNRRLGVCISIANDRLFVGSIPKTKTKQDILEEFRQHTDNLKDVIVYISAEDKYKNRGFAFLEYDTHKAAALARRRLMSGRVKVWGHIVPSVDWADPLEEPDTETMAKVRVVHVRNVSPSTTEDSLQQTFSQFGEVERVKKLKSYAFIHYKERDSAMKAIEQMHSKPMDGLVIEVSLAKPQQSREKRHGQSGFGALNAPGQQPMGGGGFQGRGRGMRGRGGPRGRGFGGPRGGYGGGYNEGYGGYNEGYGGYNEGYGGGYGDGYEGGNGYGGGYDGYGGGNGYGGGYEGYDNSYGGGYGGGYENSYGGDGGYGGGGYGGGGRGGGGPRGRGGSGGPRGGPRGRGGPGGRGGPPGRGGPRGGPGRGGPGGRGGPRGGPRGGRGAPGAGGVQMKRKYEGEGGGSGGGTVSYPEPKRRFNQAGSQPIAQQPLEQNNQGYGGGYDQNNQWYQDSSYQQWS